MPDLPRPDVDATPDMGTDTEGRRYIDVTISRGEQTKTYRGTGHTQGAVTIDVVKQIIADPYSAEWLPAGKRP